MPQMSFIQRTGAYKYQTILASNLNQHRSSHLIVKKMMTTVGFEQYNSIIRFCPGIILLAIYYAYFTQFSISSQLFLVCLTLIIIIAMENALIMNKIPLPRYYDGTSWNTVFKPTRRSIPKYLHEDLPELKLLQLKERFKQIGKFNCPRLEYFDDYIRKHNTHREKSKAKTSRSTSQKKEYERLQEEFQYALLLCDKESSVLDGLVNKAKVVKYQKEKRPFEKGRYFEGTIDLVFRNRKNVYLSQQKNRREDDASDEAAKKVEAIKLLPFN